MGSNGLARRITSNKPDMHDGYRGACKKYALEYAAAKVSDTVQLCAQKLIYEACPAAEPNLSSQRFDY